MMYLICKSWYEYAERSIPQRKLDRYRKMVDSYYNFVSEFPESEQYKRQLDRMFAESKAYVDYNQQLTMEVEKSQIDVDSKQQNINVQRDLIKEMFNPIERAEAEKKLKADRKELRKMKKEMRIEAKKLKKQGNKTTQS
jgi:outer membrane protein assembly factor BamD